MASDRIRASFDGMRTEDTKVFAAGDGAFGGSTIVMAMHHGQRAAYYVKAFLEGRENPLAYRTPYRTRRVPVAQDLLWEKLPLQAPAFFGLGANPIEFPEIEATYSWEMARSEAARCYRCDAETGSADYSVQHREDIFSMARTNPLDYAKHRAMLERRLRSRENPFPQGRAASLDDLVFLPANLSRLVIDPYREACRIDIELGGRLRVGLPFLASGFDEAPGEVRDAVARGLVAAGCGYLGRRPLGETAPWFQLLAPGEAPSRTAAALVYRLEDGTAGFDPDRDHPEQLVGLTLASLASVEPALALALDKGLDFVLISGNGDAGAAWPELTGAPDLRVLRDAVAYLRRIRREEAVDLLYFGGVRSGTDTAKLVGLGASVVVLGVALGLAAGGKIGGAPGRLEFVSDLDPDERAAAVENIIKASAGEASMMARCTGKTNLHNVEPEDLRAVTHATAQASGIPLAGTRAA